MIIAGQNKYKVLLADDDPSTLNSLRLLLEFDGHEVYTVENGAAAVALLLKGKFDILITDFEMPGMRGDELVALARHIRPDQPIIMASGALAYGSQPDNLVAGVDCLLNKPFTMQELREAIAWVIDRYADKRQAEAATQGTLNGLPPQTDKTRLPPDERSKH